MTVRSRGRSRILNLGPEKLFALFAVAVMVLGPEELPRVAANWAVLAIIRDMRARFEGGVTNLTATLTSPASNTRPSPNVGSQRRPRQPRQHHPPHHRCDVTTKGGRAHRHALSAVGALAAATIAVWPVWVNDNGLHVKCGTPVVAARSDYADGRCRRSGERRLFIAADTTTLGAFATGPVTVRSPRQTDDKPPAPERHRSSRAPLSRWSSISPAICRRSSGTPTDATRRARPWASAVLAGITVPGNTGRRRDSFGARSSIRPINPTLIASASSACRQPPGVK